MTCEKCGNPTKGSARCDGCRRLLSDATADRTWLAIGAALVGLLCVGWDYLVAIVLGRPLG
jgi:hypothetical protein